jgi:hypothetical protein
VLEADRVDARDGRELSLVGRDGVEKQLPLDQTRKFSVFKREKITLAIGDRIRFTKNVKHRGQKFLQANAEELDLGKSVVAFLPFFAESQTRSWAVTDEHPRFR